ncbi:MAG TPA: histidine phosphatase family protein [Candidatus Paceibacterota bacterium]|nr:histidine phosphatase family protein [Candidatus Paceibacterota bacterium]
MKAVVFSRHGIASYASDPNDPPLSTEGVTKVRKLAEALRQMFPEGVPPLITASPWKRAAETAGIFQEVLGGEVITRPGFGPDGKTDYYLELINRWRRKHSFIIAVAHEHLGAMAHQFRSALPNPDVRHLDYGAHVFDLEKGAYTRIEADKLA